MDKQTSILFCRCGANVISAEKADELANVLQHVNADVYELQDLCALSVHEKDVLQTIGKKYDQKLIIACYPRAISNMFRQTGVEMGNYDVLNFRTLSIAQIAEKIETEHHIKKGKARYQVEASELDVPAWYPVIDQSRCTLCGQCARFCLFGVYSYDKKSLAVVNPLACKNNCPACGRTCPSSAIIFPRLAESTVLAGEEPGKNEKRKKGREDGLFVMLNERNQARKNIFKQGVVRLAEEERRKALEEFKNSIRKEK